MRHLRQVRRRYRLGDVLVHGRSRQGAESRLVAEGRGRDSPGAGMDPGCYGYESESRWSASQRRKAIVQQQQQQW